MNYRVNESIRSDVVIIGGGIAGMMAALELAPLSVLLITKKDLGDGSSSRLAQGGIAAAIGSLDDPALHANDTLSVGKGLSDPSIVRLTTSKGPELIRRLLDLGADFDRDNNGQLALGQEAAHSRRRIVHANGDATGAEVVRVLTRSVRLGSHIRVLEHSFASDLITDGSRIHGIIVRTRENEWIQVHADSTVLSTGGIGSLYSYSTNPPEATGDGIAMAARAGITLSDLEFVQFHPTALASNRQPLSLLTEAIRGEGAILVDDLGNRFMLNEHPDAELAPRDTVSRAIWKKRIQGHGVFLDAREAIGMRFKDRFPTAFNNCMELGIDPRTDLIPVCPAAHYHVGGIHTDERGRASHAGLWACGEVASTKLHGANRLASNSLLEAMVFGVEVGKDIKSDWKTRAAAGRYLPPVLIQTGPEPVSARSRLQTLMWENVGLVRNESGLNKALSMIYDIQDSSTRGPGELNNMLTTARLITQSALQRKESRGVHFREDFPETSGNQAEHITITHPVDRIKDTAVLAK